MLLSITSERILRPATRKPSACLSRGLWNVNEKIYEPPFSSHNIVKESVHMSLWLRVSYPATHLCLKINLIILQIYIPDTFYWSLLRKLQIASVRSQLSLKLGLSLCVHPGNADDNRLHHILPPLVQYVATTEIGQKLFEASVAGISNKYQEFISAI